MPRPKNSTCPTRCPPSADSYFLGQTHCTGTLSVVIAAHALDARRLYEEMRSFWPYQIRFLPDWETLPYELLSPQDALLSERIETLWKMHHAQVDMVIMPAITGIQRLAPPQYFAESFFNFRVGQVCEFEALRAQLVCAGYEWVKKVLLPREYATRGGIIDVYPMGSTCPYRLDFYDQKIASITIFDVDTQHSIKQCEEMRIFPGREFPLHSAGREQFCRRYSEFFTTDRSKSLLCRDIQNGLTPAGIEYYLPLFFEKTATLADYLPQNTAIFLHGPIEKRINQFLEETKKRHLFLQQDYTRPVLPPQQLYQSSEHFFCSLSPFRHRSLTNDTDPQGNAATIPDGDAQHKKSPTLEKINTLLTQYPTYQVRIVAGSLGRRQSVHDLLDSARIPHDLSDALYLSQVQKTDHALSVCVGTLQHSFIVHREQIVFMTERDLCTTIPAPLHTKADQTQLSLDGWVRQLTDLQSGQLVVHRNHGIGRYKDLVTIKTDDIEEADFILIEYADDAQLYVPVSELNLISRYQGIDSDSVHLHPLDKRQWDKAKKEAQRCATDTAAELLSLYAIRAAHQAQPCTVDPKEYLQFIEHFGFIATKDQQSTIDAVIHDLSQSKPMDRLVCGDVGFGKTEVALRAAFVVACSGKQVVVMCPTTLLAEQHAQLFFDRFAAFPIKIHTLSRFSNKKEIQNVLTDLSTGRADIVVGTHRLLQQDVTFHNLGLIVIDEEHRFGVTQKETLKKLRTNVHTLMLTATPIPRTLSMSLEGIRDFSIISTPPQRRLSIKTMVTEMDKDTIRDALMRELKRGGQIYFVHNEVKTIERMYEKLTAIAPEARIIIGHGQMQEKMLENVMQQFQAQHYNVLLCTTIIENGIDNPNANTIIIHQASRFGLAQLHQLRGRVGRSYHQAYAYLVVGDRECLTADAEKRLAAIQEMDHLGSGFYLAMHDLEIRGAGELLGRKQSGAIHEVGFDLYHSMLQQAIRDMKQRETQSVFSFQDTFKSVHVHETALLPSEYCQDVSMRLMFYKRLADCMDHSALQALEEEMINCCGCMPPTTRLLMDMHRLRILGQEVGICRIDTSVQKTILEFIDQPNIETALLVRILSEYPKSGFASATSIRVNIPLPTAKERVDCIELFFKKLASAANLKKSSSYP